MSITLKAGVDLTGLGIRLDRYSSGVIKNLDTFGRGVGCDKILEPIPEFIAAKCERVVAGSNNAFIVFGRDRPTDRLSGYGGKGHTQCGMIDITVGRSSANPRQVDENNEKIYVDPDFTTDAARIYVSQKSDIDDYMNLTPGRVGNPKPRSSIGLKADAIRIVAREGIKLVTGTDRLNSQGGAIKAIHGIDLIAGNLGDELQSIAKGDDLVKCLVDMSKRIDELNGIVDSLVMFQAKMNAAVATHTHILNITGLPPVALPSTTLISSGISTAASIMTQTKRSLMVHKVNLVNLKYNYLSPAGKYYIASRWNNTN